MSTVTTHGAATSLRGLCASLGVAPATYYRARRRAERPTCAMPRRSPPRALAPVEHQRILDVLHDDRFIDLAPAQVYATLLDEGVYHCAERTMYRLLAAHDEIRERRAQRRHPVYTAPELLAVGTECRRDRRWGPKMASLAPARGRCGHHLADAHVAQRDFCRTVTHIGRAGHLCRVSLVI